MHTVSLPCQPLPAHCIRTTPGNMVACLRAGEHFFPTCACPARYNAWARSSRLETRTKESSMPASSWVATIYVCATKILAGICAPATDFSLMGSLSVSTPARTRKNGELCQWKANPGETLMGAGGVWVGLGEVWMGFGLGAIWVCLGEVWVGLTYVRYFFCNEYILFL